MSERQKKNYNAKCKNALVINNQQQQELDI